MNKRACIFLDRDGVLNKERGEYTFRVEDFDILPDVQNALSLASEHNYLLIIITNQAGIAKGLYRMSDVEECYHYLQKQTGNYITDMYVAHQHPTVTESLLRKPNSLMFEKAIYKYNIDNEQSWMVGDSMSDMEAAKNVGLKTCFIKTRKDYDLADYKVSNLFDAVQKIITHNSQ